MFCKDCNKKPTCTEICRDLENYLHREQSKEGYSARHIRRKEVPYAPRGIIFLEQKTLDKVYGIKKDTKHKE